MGKISKILLESLFVSASSAEYSVTGCNDEAIDVSTEKIFLDGLHQILCDGFRPLACFALGIPYDMGHMIWILRTGV